MLMADTMAVFFVVLGVMVSFAGCWLLVRGLWPERVLRAADRLERGLVAPFLVGLPVVAVGVVAAAVTASLPGKLGGIGAGAIASALVVYAHVGVSGLATSIGRRLPSAVDASSPWRATLRGSVVLVLAYLTPVIGWFAILPVTTIAGAGATTIGLLARRRAPSPGAAPFVVGPADAASA
jgi:hypothetical protein